MMIKIWKIMDFLYYFLTFLKISNSIQQHALRGIYLVNERFAQDIVLIKQ